MSKIGYASEITEDIPDGLEFIWSEKTGNELEEDTTLSEQEKEAIKYNQGIWDIKTVNKDTNKVELITTDYLAKAKDEKANALVELYKENLKNTSSQTNRENLNNSWDEYATTLKNQDYARKYGLIPYTCALHFKDADTDARYQKGGICYYSTSTK